MEHRPTDERRAQITAALLCVMAEQGYEKATIAKIAAEAGLTAGLLHYHFKNKQQILLALLDELVLTEMLALRPPPGSPAEQLVSIVDRLLATGDSARPTAVAAWVIISAESIRQPAVAARLRVAFDGFASAVTAVIEAGVRDRSWQPGYSSAEIAAALLALVQGYFTLAATARDLVPRGSAARTARALLGAMLETELT